MGSLMAGWDSHVPDPKFVKLKRNKSLTKEEIETFWKSKNKQLHIDREAHEQHGSKNISPMASPRTQLASIFEEASKGIERANSEPPMPTMGQVVDMETRDTTTTGLDKLIKKNGWWISSRWAFLNEPPVLQQGDGATHRYASQYHVADMSGNSNTRHGPSRISA